MGSDPGYVLEKQTVAVLDARIAGVFCALANLSVRGRQRVGDVVDADRQRLDGILDDFTWQRCMSWLERLDDMLSVTILAQI